MVLPLKSSSMSEKPSVFAQATHSDVVRVEECFGGMVKSESVANRMPKAPLSVC